MKLAIGSSYEMLGNYKEEKMDIKRGIKEFKSKYPMTIMWRKLKHAAIAEKYINADEQVLYTFGGQRADYDNKVFFYSSIVVLTNKRILVAQKRFFWRHKFFAITPDLFNDMKVRMGIIWGKVMIDTLREKVIIDKIDKRALVEIESYVSKYMMQEKKRYKEPIEAK